MLDRLFARFTSRGKKKVKVCGFCGSKYGKRLKGCPVCVRIMGPEYYYVGEANNLVIHRPWSSTAGLEQVIVQGEKEIQEVELSPNRKVVFIRWKRYPPHEPGARNGVTDTRPVI